MRARQPECRIVTDHVHRAFRASIYYGAYEAAQKNRRMHAGYLRRILRIISSRSVPKHVFARRLAVSFKPGPFKAASAPRWTGYVVVVGRGRRNRNQESARVAARTPRTWLENPDIRPGGPVHFRSRSTQAYHSQTARPWRAHDFEVQQDAGQWRAVHDSDQTRKNRSQCVHNTPPLAAGEALTPGTLRRT